MQVLCLQVLSNFGKIHFHYCLRHNIKKYTWQTKTMNAFSPSMCRIRQMKNWNFFGWYLILNIIFRCFSSSKVRCWHAEGFLRARHCRLVAFVSCLLWWSSWSKHDKTIHLKNTQWRSKKWGNYIKNLLESLSLWPCVTIP